MTKQPDDDVFDLKEDGLDLVGLFFLIPVVPGFFNDYNYQGQVRGKASETVYIVTYNEWFTGSRNTTHLVSLDTMVAGDWHFFKYCSDWRAFYSSHQRRDPFVA